MTMTPRRAFPAQNYWPEDMEPQTFYEPTDRGFEAKVARTPCLLGRKAEKAGTTDRTVRDNGD